MEYIIIQAGGKGTRLGYLTKNKPKALLPVDNLPMLFHLFQKYPDKRFIVIGDYHRDVLREYLAAFADVKYQMVDADGTGTCAGIKQALALIPDGQPFLLIWSDLILPDALVLPESYEGTQSEGEGHCQNDYIGISKTFFCRWSYRNGKFIEEPSDDQGVAGFFLFTDKGKLKGIPANGELVRWMQQKKMQFQEISLAGTEEFGLLETYQRLERARCRPFNRITVSGDILIKEAVDSQGQALAAREYAWYEEARCLMVAQNGREGDSQPEIDILPRIYGKNPLRMEYIRGKNLYECDLDRKGKRHVLEMLISALRSLHALKRIPADTFSVREAYYQKTVDRLSRIEDLVPFARDRYILINGKKCRNVYFHKRELEKKLEQIVCEEFCFIHGDCTFSNLLLRENGTPALIDPRGYFGFTELYGDERYDWAKLYYSIVGNYDKFNLKEFRLDISGQGVLLEIASNHWEDMEEDFFELTGANKMEMKLLHAVIWMSLTTYAWQDFDSVCGAFYNGLYYLEDVL